MPELFEHHSLSVHGLECTVDVFTSALQEIDSVLEVDFTLIAFGLLVLLSIIVANLTRLPRLNERLVFNPVA